MNKDELRRCMIERRNSLNNKDIEKKSQTIISNLSKLSVYKYSKFIFVYVSFRSEVITKGFIMNAIKDGKRIAVPITLAEKKIIQPCEIRSLNELAPGTWGILEPKKGNYKVVDSSQIDLAIVPGLAFDYSFNRLGYGAGYYDRFLPSMNSLAIKIGICYDFQLIDSLPAEKYDIPMDVIITEKRLLFRDPNKISLRK